MNINPYLNFDGNCAEAFKFYEGCLRGKIEMIQTHGESPVNESVPPAWHDKVVHARLAVGNTVLMGSDAPPGHYAPAAGLFVSIGVAELEEARRIFDELSENGKILMPFAKTFWSAGFGMFVDRFGTPWMVNCEKPA